MVVAGDGDAQVPSAVQADTINPSDQGAATKSADTILRQEIEIGEEQLQRSGRGLFLSAVSAGLDIGFGPLMVVTVLASSSEQMMSTRLVGALLYAVGFIIVILGRSELFTEHTTPECGGLSLRANTWTPTPGASDNLTPDPRLTTSVTRDRTAPCHGGPPTAPSPLSWRSRSATAEPRAITRR